MKTLIITLLVGMLSLTTLPAQEKNAGTAKETKSCCAGKATADTTTMNGAGDETAEAAAEPARPVINNGVQEITVTVKDGYTPNLIEVKRGQPVRLNFSLEEQSCTGTVIFKGLKIKKNLTYGKVTPVEFTPKKAGSYTFACPMNMTTGTLVVTD